MPTNACRTLDIHGPSKMLHTLPVLTNGLEARVFLGLVLCLVRCGKTLPSVESTVGLVDELSVPSPEVGCVFVLEPVVK